MVKTNLYRLKRSIIGSKFVLKRSTLMCSGGIFALMNQNAGLVNNNVPNIPTEMLTWLQGIDYTLLSPNIVDPWAFLSSILMYAIGVITQDTITNTHGIMDNAFVFTHVFSNLNIDVINTYAPTFLNDPNLMHYIPHMMFQVYSNIHMNELPVAIIPTTVNPTEFVFDFFNTNWRHYFPGIQTLNNQEIVRMLLIQAAYMGHRLMNDNNGIYAPSEIETREIMSGNNVHMPLTYWQRLGPILGLMLFIVNITHPDIQWPLD